ncbi:hypothetical protein GPX89_17100 [Nocardia sp. ET3-3]|uniref:YbaB/EbfC family nucleoid-associated protein n=1 Tax=Nocardia terrae TaxID=2675851 RepID=A0A7K1UXJ7_9NOCA|nr:YbaB/EbfC family nucleoid-associated protein [Nocardia terrae]MVU78957.1 hypothetical protein [Nocardia terrae]
MSTDRERIAARNARLQEAIMQVRGKVASAGGTVAVETDRNGTITDLRISQAAMSANPDQLAQVIAQCHEAARLQAQDKATELYTDQLDAPELPNPTASPGPQDSPTPPDWEELAPPMRITHTL